MEPATALFVLRALPARMWLVTTSQWWSGDVLVEVKYAWPLLVNDAVCFIGLLCLQVIVKVCLKCRDNCVWWWWWWGVVGAGHSRESLLSNGHQIVWFSCAPAKVLAAAAHNFVKAFGC